MKGSCKAEDVWSYALEGIGYYQKMEINSILARSNIPSSADGINATFRVVKVSSECVGSTSHKCALSLVSSFFACQIVRLLTHFIALTIGFDGKFGMHVGDTYRNRCHMADMMSAPT